MIQCARYHVGGTCWLPKD